MDKRTLLICGFLTATLFLFSFGAALLPKKYPDVLADNEEIDIEAAKAAAREYGNATWMKILDTLLAPFVPSLEMSRLEGSLCQRQGAWYRLDASSRSCTIEISPADQTFAQATLRLKGTQGAVVRINYKSADSTENLPWPEEGEDPQEPVKLIVGQQGGALTFACTNCSASRAVWLKLD